MIKQISTAIFTASILVNAYATEITVAAGAGFKKMVTDIAQICETDYGVKMNMSFGNLGQVMAQIKTTDLVDATIGDSRFFERAGLEFEDSYLIGNGKLVLGWRKGITLNTPSDITSDKIGRIAIPNTEKAIYGIAGTEYLESINLTDTVKDKLYIVATVPQVSSYLATGEVDAGFSNLTDIQGIKDKIGGFFLIENGYNQIDIITGIIKNRTNNKGLTKYKECINSDQVKEIAKKHGL